MADKVGILAKLRLGLPRTSRYCNTLYYPDLGPAFGRWPPNARTLSRDVTDQYYTVGAGEEFNLPALAYRFYGSVRLWWIIALANEIRNPLTAPNSGDILRIPDQTRVLAMVNAV